MSDVMDINITEVIENVLDRSKWVKWKFSDLVENFVEKVVPKDSGLDHYIGLKHLDTGSLKIRRFGETESLIGDKLKIYKGDLIFAKRNSYLKRVAIAEFDAVASAHALVLRPNSENVNPDFLPFFMMSEKFWQRAIEISVGSLSPTINWKVLAKQEFLLPPKDQQAQLSKLLWAMDEVIEKERELHNRAHSTYLSMRSNLMIGKEIIDFETKENYKKVKKFGQIPVNWEVKKLSELCVKIQDGNYGESYPKKDELLKDGVPFITSTIISGDNFDDTKLKYISEEKHLILKKAHVKSEDILLTNRGANVGRCAITPERMDDANIGPQVTLIRCDSDNLNNQYLYHFIRSNYVQKQIEIANAGSAMNFMSLTATGAFSIVCPSLETQKLISNRLNLIYSKLESIELKIKGSQSLQKSLINQIF